MRRAAVVFVCSSVLGLGLVHCVGDSASGTAANDSGVAADGSGTAGDGSSVIPGQDGATTDAGGGTDGGVSPTDAGDAGDAGDGALPPPPSPIASSSLWAWVTADRGVSCAGNRITKWADQSGKGHDALPASPVAPQCGIHKINGIDVPYLSRPTTDGGVAPFDDEVFNIDLTALANSNFTIFVVSHYEMQASTNNRYGLVGTLTASTAYPPGYDTGNVNGTVNSALDFSFGRTTHLYVDLNYNTQFEYAVPVPMATPSVDVLWFDAAVGHTLYHNDGATAVASNTTATGMTKLTNGLGGSIGRALFHNIDSRFYGYIAEVAVYNAALPPAQVADLVTYGKTHWGL